MNSGRIQKLIKLPKERKEKNKREQESKKKREETRKKKDDLGS